ncbi:Transcription factor bHLH84 [Rhynchospora pubera]|uniref:Transcription factor bHLH84 n=1 Tax=Rhynchospora pubera TaxID=906938 RepID=A0AAV8CJ35_9POAL|nr:Transcription factor bHLH84 [Rhynchospora pubera]
MEVGTYMSVKESEVMTQLLGAHCFQDYNSDFISCLSSSYYSNNWPQEDTYIGLSCEDAYIGINCEDLSAFCNTAASEINEDMINSKSIKRKCEMESMLDSCIEPLRKKNEWEENEGMSQEKIHQDSSSSLFENDSTNKSRASNSTGKYTKHSLYARKRREKINQRLRTLQKLIPNGTKVDISTMLEEAYQYVKFLQLQIKLLSSEEHWMYAPIAFNGITDGLNLDISQANQSRFNMA